MLIAFTFMEIWFFFVWWEITANFFSPSLSLLFSISLKQKLGVEPNCCSDLYITTTTIAKYPFSAAVCKATPSIIISPKLLAAAMMLVLLNICFSRAQANQAQRSFHFSMLLDHSGTTEWMNHRAKQSKSWMASDSYSMYPLRIYLSLSRQIRHFLFFQLCCVSQSTRCWCCGW